jgi:4-alpha-glucanotransferase
MRVVASQLRHLANLCGIQTSYLDMDNHIQQASKEALLAILKALGAPVNTLLDVPAAIREKKIDYWRQVLEPVLVFWEGQTPVINLHLPSSLQGTELSISLIQEDGQRNEYLRFLNDNYISNSTRMEGLDYLTANLSLPGPVPQGYHRLKVELPGRIVESMVISAPLKTYCPSGIEEKIWGIFSPLYSLHSCQSWGAGDLTDFTRLIDWVSGKGGRLVGTLPLLATFFEGEMGPSPYMPASRLFWNEFFLNILQIPELNQCSAAQSMINSPNFQNAVSKLGSSRYVDYNPLLALKKSILELLSEYLFTERPPRFGKLQEFCKNKPSAADYARFRAAGEQNGIRWQDWPQRLRDGELADENYPQKTAEYYLYSQWLAEEQIGAVAREAAQKNILLYLDMPVGVHPFSYDVWRERESFVQTVNGGAPPDPVFTSGQNWNFPPLHPEKIRQQSYRYVIDSFRHQVKVASMLRIDHMMNFHRLFWVPEGLENRQGVYVSYHSEEFYAILALESCRHKAIIIGEDLGMVPPEVRPMMEKHGIYRMFVGQYQLITENRLGQVPPRSVASLNTHDMFPFSAFWQEEDVVERRKLKLLNARTAAKELKQRREVKQALVSHLSCSGVIGEDIQNPENMLRPVLNLLASSPAYALLINLEDLWLEEHPQNIPGTHNGKNWRQKQRLSFEEFSQSCQVLDILYDINHIREGKSRLP